ncbi:hypothetical protein B0O99DRAFT_319463 [Bisporella sp. PMI_857]|nr:hypothetical protein B0O99DRAFT_319463 [Bisporella sp. PMI_857]
MSFGYSIGDFIAGANLCYTFSKSISGTDCASEECREALTELGHLQHMFFQVGRWTTNPKLASETANAAAYLVISSIQLIRGFLDRTKELREKLLSGRGSNAFSDKFQRVNWALFKREEWKCLKDTLQEKRASISLLLDSARLSICLNV